jgi:methylated-DNA-protein-cysteine methyltransferase related protein
MVRIGMTNRSNTFSGTDPNDPVYQRIYTIVRLIPPGKVATYGQIAAIVGNCTARMVGYAMAGLPHGSDVPWQRVINAQGKISPRADGSSTELQFRLLQEEGVRFDSQARVDLRHYRWAGPDMGWLIEHGFDPGPLWRET